MNTALLSEMWIRLTFFFPKTSLKNIWQTPEVLIKKNKNWFVIRGEKKINFIYPLLTYPNWLSVNDVENEFHDKAQQQRKNNMTLNKFNVLGNFQFDDSIWRAMNFGRPLRKNIYLSNKRLFTKKCTKAIHILDNDARLWRAGEKRGAMNLVNDYPSYPNIEWVEGHVHDEPKNAKILRRNKSIHSLSRSLAYSFASACRNQRFMCAIVCNPLAHTRNAFLHTFLQKPESVDVQNFCIYLAESHMHEKIWCILTPSPYCSIVIIERVGKERKF
jgi:hypothetical protein